MSSLNAEIMERVEKATQEMKTLVGNLERLQTNTSLDASEADYGLLNTSLDESKKEVAELTQNLGLTKLELGEKTTLLAAANEKITGLESAATLRSQQITDLETKGSQLETKRSEWETRASQFEARASERDTRIRTLLSQNQQKDDDYTTALQDWNLRRTKLEEESTTWESAADNRASTIKTLREEVSKSNMQLDEAQKRIVNLQKSKDEDADIAGKQLEEARASLANLQKLKDEDARNADAARSNLQDRVDSESGRAEEIKAAFAMFMGHEPDIVDDIVRLRKLSLSLQLSLRVANVPSVHVFLGGRREPILSTVFHLWKLARNGILDTECAAAIVDQAEFRPGQQLFLPWIHDAVHRVVYTMATPAS